MLQKNQTTILAQIIQVSRTNIMNFKREKSAKVSQENRFDCNKIFIDLAYSYFKKDIDLMKKYEGKLNIASYMRWLMIYVLQQAITSLMNFSNSVKRMLTSHKLSQVIPIRKYNQLILRAYYIHILWWSVI